MNRNLLKLIVACGAACFIACTPPQKAETEKWSERMARSEMKRFPEPWMIEKAKKPRWGYTHGLVVKSMLEEWKHTGDSTYYDYAKIYADSLIDADGHIRTMKYLSFNIDNVNGGKILFDLYAQTGDERYKIAMDTLRKQMAEQPRTSEGGFWHKLKYPHQMWLDGIFMASPYLAQYGATFHESGLFDEAVKQTGALRLFGPWDYSTKQIGKVSGLDWTVPLRMIVKPNGAVWQPVTFAKNLL
jgi:unsaturated rhamnogalacturonyl hydrolase